jgi:hypothetical protein
LRRKRHYRINADSNWLRRRRGQSGKLEQGCLVVISLYGATQFAKLMGQSFITEEGEAIEGESRIL